MSRGSSWSFDGFAGDRVIVVLAREAGGSALVPLSAALAPGLLRRWLADPVTRRTLVEMAEGLSGRGFEQGWEQGDMHVPMVDEMARAFERGDLVLFGVPAVEAPQLGQQPGRRPSSRPPPAKKAWIEIELLDDDGRPVATELVVTLPDGTRLTPAFRGKIRLDGIDPGTCDIEFPKIDGREWGPDARAPAR